MGLFINNRAYGTPYINGVRMQTAYINGRNIWRPFPADAFVIRFVDPDTGVGIQGSITPSWNADGPNLEYKKSHGIWTPFEKGTEITSEKDGYIAFRGKGRSALYKNSSGSPWSATQSFTVTGKFGNLIDYESPDSPSVPSCGFFALFRNSTVIEADLILNAVSGSQNSNGMSFGYMFEKSTLRKAKITGMYKTNTPECAAWNTMFSNSLVTLVDIDFTAWGRYDYWPNCINWMKGVPAGGTFYKPSALPENKGGRDDIPASWTVVNK
jgi:hypothetical protein